jgi:hypothetical protein
MVLGVVLVVLGVVVVIVGSGGGGCKFYKIPDHHPSASLAPTKCHSFVCPSPETPTAT